MEVAASTEDDEIRCSGLAKRPEKNAKFLPRGSLFVAGAPRRNHAGAQPQAPLRLTGPAPSAVERPPRSSLPRSLGRQLGGSRAASQRALTTRLGCSACREDVPDRTSALSLCRRAQRRRHHTFVRGGARRSCSRVQLHRSAGFPSLCSLLHCGCRRYPRRAGAACLRASKWLQCLGCPPGPGVAGMWGRGVAALRRPAPAALVPARRMSSRSAFQLPWESKPQEISKVRAYSRPARGERAPRCPPPRPHTAAARLRCRRRPSARR